MYGMNLFDDNYIERLWKQTIYLRTIQTSTLYSWKRIIWSIRFLRGTQGAVWRTLQKSQFIPLTEVALISLKRLVFIRNLIMTLTLVLKNRL